MKQKIAVVTLVGTYNYGNRLQNYAVKKILEKEGCSVTTIDCKSNRIKDILRFFRLIIGVFTCKPQYLREVKFRIFNFKYINLKTLYNKNGLINRRISLKYDYFVTGSDQVWNPEIRKDQKDNFFLRFCDRSQRIALSPSIGVETIPDSCLTEYQVGLTGFPYLSCREEEGVNELERITGKQCVHLIDPTLALTREEWISFSKKVSCPDKYLLVFFLGNISKDIRLKINDFAKKYNLEVIEVTSNNSKYFISSPTELVYLVSKATMVFTDSFHITAFSINLHIPFYTFERCQDEDETKKLMSRLHSLLRMMGMNQRLYSGNTLLDFQCIFEYSDAVLSNERAKLGDYLSKCLNQKCVAPFNLPDSKCTGCGVCSLKCPKSCIEMKYDSEGFLRPLIDISRCINCNKCIHNCPVLNLPKKNTFKEIKSYATYQCDTSAVLDSSSGAVFPLLAKYIIEQGGIVYGAKFDEDFSVVHGKISKIEDIEQFKGSKYVQSRIDILLDEVKKDLLDRKKVLFVGTPCQIAALKRYLGCDYENLYVIDFVCHGVPSPQYWDSYLNSISNKYLDNEKIAFVRFRDKGKNKNGDCN